LRRRPLDLAIVLGVLAILGQAMDAALLPETPRIVGVGVEDLP
jgi:hypothetical protein